MYCHTAYECMHLCHKGMTCDRSEKKSGVLLTALPWEFWVSEVKLQFSVLSFTTVLSHHRRRLLNEESVPNKWTSITSG